ncbi:MAG: hypothetical protein QNJ68_22345 [Microcoleaceae cyanobacterium MO_207.B10]|nr:hypothetical protein [Microcoleaceae cyanobacterium MO_207.B10]
MTVIQINDLEINSYLSELNEVEINSTRGGILPAIGAFWLGYEIGKEIARLTK